MRHWLMVTAVSFAAAGGPAAQNPPVVLQESARSELIQIEVWARTSDGRPVTDLEAAELDLFVDGIRLPIAGLEPALAREAVPSASREQGPAEAPTITGGDRWERRYLLFFNDALSTPEHMTSARKSALAFLAEDGRSGDRFAVASYEEHRRLQVLLDFTPDRGAVRAAVNRSLADGARASDLMLSLTAPAQIGAGGSAREAARQAASVAEMLGAQVRSSGRGVRGGLEALIDSLAPYPGHKALVYFGDGLMGVPRADMVALTRTAIASGVTVHTADTIGLIAGVAPQLTATSPHQMLVAFASETGGLSRLANDAGLLLHDIEAAPESGYVLSFVPPGVPDGATHRIRVVCRRAGVTLRHRPEFLHRTPEQAREHALQAAFLAPAMRQAFGLDLAVPVVPSPDRSGAAVDLIAYVPPGRLLILPGPSGSKVDFEAGLVALDDKGVEVARWSRTLSMNLDASESAAAKGRPLDLRLRQALPAGAQSATLVIADRQSGEIGASRWSRPERPAGPRAGPILIADPDEPAIWFDVPIGTGPGSARPRARGTDAAVRSRFQPGARPHCQVRLPADLAAAEVRLVVAGADGLLQVQSVSRDDFVGGEGRDGIVLVPLRTESLGVGEFELRVEAAGPDGLVELGRTFFSLSGP
jgi:VWFA-related protein